MSGKDSYERCELCGLGRHRFMFPTDGQHKPDAVACANSIIGEIEDNEDELNGRASRQRHAKIVTAITKMAYAINSLDRLVGAVDKVLATYRAHWREGKDTIIESDALELALARDDLDDLDRADHA